MGAMSRLKVGAAEIFVGEFAILGRSNQNAPSPATVSSRTAMSHRSRPGRVGADTFCLRRFFTSPVAEKGGTMHRARMAGDYFFAVVGQAPSPATVRRAPPPGEPNCTNCRRGRLQDG